MEYYTLGKTGLRVSRLALGTMTFGEEWGWGANDGIARELFDTYVDAGGNLFDTADLYTNGTSEQMLGKFIADSGIRDKAVITTKFSYNAEPGNPNAGGNGRKNILRAVEGSLRRLGTDYIDVYMLHTWDQITPAEEVVRTMDDLVRAGKVRYVAISDTPAWYLAQANAIASERGLEPISTVQLEYSLVERNIEFEFASLARATGIGVMVWSPLGGGVLSGKYRPSESGAEGSGRLKTLEGSGNPAFEKFTDRNWKIVAELESVAKELNRSMAQVAVNWVVNRPFVSSVIVGATKVEQLTDNLSALDFTIPDQLESRLNVVSQPEVRFPYTFFEPALQGMLTGGTVVGDKPSSFHSGVRVEGEGAGVEQ